MRVRVIEFALQMYVWSEVITVCALICLDMCRRPCSYVSGRSMFIHARAKDVLTPLMLITFCMCYFEPP